MATFPDAPDYHYVAYIDEAGDPGLTKVKPIDPDGASEWLVLSAVLVRHSNDLMMPGWVTQIVRDLDIRQRRDIHFRRLSPTRKLVACQKVAALPIKIFTVASNKKNMRGYKNDRAEKKQSSQQWFYNWIVRILIERITNFVADHSMEEAGEIRRVSFEFSQRGGHSYSQTAAYHELLKSQTRGDGPYLQKWTPVAEAMHFKLVNAYPHEERAGLQLADVVASAFYTAVDCIETGPCDPRYAQALEPRVAFRGNRRYSDYGVVLQPTGSKAKLTLEQQAVFEFYGYGFP